MRFPGSKLLKRIDGETLIERVVSTVQGSSVDRVIVVTGHDAQRMADALKGLECEIVFNRRYAEGMSSSIKAGVSAVRNWAEAVLILPADVALVTSRTIDVVLRKYRRGATRIVVASHEGRGGHPILFSRELFEEIMAIDEETQGLRAVVSRHRGEVVRVEAGSDVLVDIDTKEDFYTHFGGADKGPA